MSRAKIADATTKLWLSGGADRFSIRAVAESLDVAPATIRAHFKGGIADLLGEIVRSTLAELAPPYKPHQDPKNYLRDFFRRAQAAFRQKPQLGRLVILHLSDDPLLSPTFAERICATLEAIAKEPSAGWALEQFVGRLAGLVIVETASWRAEEPEAIKSKFRKRMSALSSVEFPTLTAAGEKITSHMMKRCAVDPSHKSADAAAEAMIAKLEKGET